MRIKITPKLSEVAPMDSGNDKRSAAANSDQEPKEDDEIIDLDESFEEESVNQETEKPATDSLQNKPTSEGVESEPKSASENTDDNEANDVAEARNESAAATKVTDPLIADDIIDLDDDEPPPSKIDASASTLRTLLLEKEEAVPAQKPKEITVADDIIDLDDDEDDDNDGGSSRAEQIKAASKADATKAAQDSSKPTTAAVDSKAVPDDEHSTNLSSEQIATTGPGSGSHSPIPQIEESIDTAPQAVAVEDEDAQAIGDAEKQSERSEVPAALDNKDVESGPKPVDDDDNSNDVELIRDLSDSNDATTLQESRPAKRKYSSKMMTLRQEGHVENFNPDLSTREKKKLRTKINNEYLFKKKNIKKMYNASGIHLATNLDLCDCLVRECQGCFFPCRKCAGPKCAGYCRNQRSWSYLRVTYDGQTEPTINPSLCQ